MERTIEFKNFQQSGTQISADLYLDGEFVVRLLDNAEHLLKAKNTEVTLYEYFRKASIYYMSQSNVSTEYLQGCVGTAH